MRRSLGPPSIILSLILIAPPVSAQFASSKPRTPSGSPAGREKTDAKVEAERVREGRRLQARAILFSLSGEARKFRDQTLRARSLARIADALWGVAAEQGRALFREAWEAAEQADRESEEPLNLRREVLTRAARRDGTLAEEFLQKLTTDRRGTEAEPPRGDSPSQGDLWELPEALEKRLGLAKHLLAAGDVERALQYADPVLGSVTISTVDFLTELREKDPAAADRRYGALLANTSGNLLADANTVSLLSSYIFTPHLYVIFHPDGGTSSATMRAPLPAAAVPPSLRLAFFRTAGSLLLRPQPPPGQDRSTTGGAGRYVALKRLLPLFERYAPQEITQAVRGLFEALNSAMSDDLRWAEDEWVHRGITPERPLAERERSLLDEIERAGSSDERDQLYFKLALLSLGDGETRARDYASKIEDSSFRQRARAWVDWSLAVRAVEKRKVEAALELARGGELTHIQRVWLLTQSAKLLAKTDRNKALSLLDDAREEVSLIERADPDRPRGHLAVASALTQVEPSRVWDALLDAVEAANSSEGFTGADGVLTLTINSKSQILTKREAAPDFDIEGVFGKAASADFDRAVQIAGGFKGEAARTNATIAIALAVLNEKDAPARTQRPAARD